MPSLSLVFACAIVIFTVITSLYLWTNDFAKETVEIVYPVVGAIVFSFYLGAKTIWVDRPAPSSFEDSIAVLHDPKTGQISTMVPIRLGQTMQSMQRFRGLRDMEKYQIYNVFKKLNLPKKLTITNDTQQEAATDLIVDLCEYAILEWLNNPDLLPGSRSSTVFLPQGGGGSIFTPSDLVAVSVVNPENEYNPLLSASDLKLKLPRDSKLTRRKPTSSYPARSIEIETPHCTLKIQIVNAQNFNVFNSSLTF